MLESIISFDKELFFLINQANHPFVDHIMYWVSNKFIWIPLYLALAVIIVKKYNYKSLLIFGALAVLILFVDQTTSTLMKPFFGRLRPCHDPLISDFVHLVSNCGGKYSFVSGHAANSFAVAIFLWLYFDRSYLVPLIIWASVIAYSRIYLGVHYPFDILAGAVFGSISGWLVFKGYATLNQRIFNRL
jgi:undecaprenyl-diphosphatase